MYGKIALESVVVEYSTITIYFTIYLVYYEGKKGDINRSSCISEQNNNSSYVAYK